MNTVVSFIAAEAIPAFVLHIAITASNQKGGARLTKALSSIGPGGMIGGLITLGLIQIFSFISTDKLIEIIFKCGIRQMIKDGASQEEINETINSYKISAGLKERLRKKARSSFNGSQEG